MDFALPPVGEGLIEVELVRWMVQPKEAVKRGHSLMEVMSDKATMEVSADFSGTIGETLAEPGGKIQVGQVVLNYTPEGEEAEDLAPVTPGRMPIIHGELRGLLKGSNGKSSAVAVPVKAAAANHNLAAAPSVRYLARKLGLELGDVKGSGPGGRILHDDLAKHIQTISTREVAPPIQTAKILFDVGKPGTRMKLLGLRRKIAEHMTASTFTIPHYSYIDECDLSDLVRIRGQLKDKFAKAGVKLTYLPFFVKAIARALQDLPIVNATFDNATQEVTMHDTYNVGIAVATPTGLIVPVLKDADKKDIAAIATEIDRLGADARAGKAKLDDLKGGSFTVTSVGNIGGLISTPIINAPEVGIMGIGKIVTRPVYDKHGEIIPAEMIYLSFSFDHRIVDGAVGATFANNVIQQIQNPAALLLPEGFAG
jgi:pyruvate dehydrogenase E2 component (dihydrolipoamide acetyltransferase)/2-oxoisovalerate dehydrogenase E2 component (dihydrolipoyl transacylase)